MSTNPCITFGCKTARKRQGVCAKCWNHYSKRIASGKTTEEKLIAAGCLLPYGSKTARAGEPTPEEIELACEEIRETWSNKVHDKRDKRKAQQWTVTQHKVSLPNQGAY